MVVSNEPPSGATAPVPELPDTAPPGQPPGWLPPDAHETRGRGRPILIGILIVGAVLVASSLAAAFMLSQSPSSGPNLQSIGFGTGGSECTLLDDASSFPLGVPVRAVVTLSPPMPAGSSVTTKLKRNGAELLDYRDTITFDEPAPCVYGTMTRLESGHYEMTFEISPSAMPPISGEFDVDLAEGATAVPTNSAASPTLPPVVAIGDEIVITDGTGAELGAAAVAEVREPAPREVPGYVAAPGYRLVVVKVRYKATALWEINMFDWALHDETGRQFEPAGFGPVPILVTRKLAPGETFEGWIGFEVPTSDRAWIDMLALDRTTFFSVEWKQ